MEEFDKRLTMLMVHFTKFNKLDENIIERVLTSDDSSSLETSDKSGDVIVHGVGGKLIKAQTVNQENLLSLFVITTWFLPLVQQEQEKHILVWH